MDVSPLSSPGIRSHTERTAGAGENSVVHGDNVPGRAMSRRATCTRTVSLSDNQIETLRENSAGAQSCKSIDNEESAQLTTSTSALLSAHARNTHLTIVSETQTLLQHYKVEYIQLAGVVT